MGQDTQQIADDIRAGIRAERQVLGRNLEELETQARALTDWRTHYRRHPGATIALAFSGGLLLGALSTGRSRRSEADIDWEQSSSESRSSRWQGLRTLADTPRTRRQVSDTWEHMLEALIGVASAKAIAWVAEKVPGFRDEYDARVDGRPMAPPL